MPYVLGPVPSVATSLAAFADTSGRQLVDANLFYGIVPTDDRAGILTLGSKATPTVIAGTYEGSRIVFPTTKSGTDNTGVSQEDLAWSIIQRTTPFTSGGTTADCTGFYLGLNVPFGTGYTGPVPTRPQFVMGLEPNYITGSQYIYEWWVRLVASDHTTVREAIGAQVDAVTNLCSVGVAGTFQATSSTGTLVFEVDERSGTPDTTGTHVYQNFTVSRSIAIGSDTISADFAMKLYADTYSGNAFQILAAQTGGHLSGLGIVHIAAKDVSYAGETWGWWEEQAATYTGAMNRGNTALIGDGEGTLYCAHVMDMIHTSGNWMRNELHGISIVFRPWGAGIEGGYSFGAEPSNWHGGSRAWAIRKAHTMPSTGATDYALGGLDPTSKKFVLLAEDGSPTMLTGSAIAPTALALGATPNWNPTDLAKARVIYVTANAAGSQLSGIVAQPDGTEITLYPDATGILTLKHNTTSTAANQFLCPGGVDKVCLAPDVVRIRYRAGSVNRWLVG